MKPQKLLSVNMLKDIATRLIVDMHREAMEKFLFYAKNEA